MLARGRRVAAVHLADAAELSNYLDMAAATGWKRSMTVVVQDVSSAPSLSDRSHSVLGSRP